MRTRVRCSSEHRVEVAAGPSDLRGFARSIIDWQRSCGRQGLPWQNTRDPYRIWLSEIMLQQTQVATAIPYYERFLARFPDVHALAASSEEAVLEAWSGLGYYSRARNLHACAKTIVAQHGGRFPADPAVLQSLSGIGRSTAAAIAAFAFDVRGPILDGNVRRVLSRVSAEAGQRNRASTERRLWSLAESLCSDSECDDMVAYTQGLMDLGATVCNGRKPACDKCPVARLCKAHKEGRAAEYPVKKPKQTLPVRYADLLAVVCKGSVLLERRPSKGLWGGLWSLPQSDPAAEGTQNGPAPASPTVSDRPFAFELVARKEALGFKAPVAEALHFTHTFSHFRLNGRVLRCAVDQITPAPSTVQYRWIAKSDIAGAALPQPIRDVLLALVEPVFDLG